MSSSSLSRVGVSLIRGIRGLSSRNLSRFNVSVPVSVSSLSSSSPSLSSLSFPSSYRSFSSGLLQPGTGRLKQTKRDLLTFLDDECRDLTRPDDEEMKAYMDEQGLVATFDAKNNQITLKRSVENVTASIRFLVEPDGEDDMNQENPEHQPEGGEEGENENQQQEGEEGQDPNEEQPPKPAVHSFIVDLNINGANGAPNSFLRVYAHADQNGQLIVDNLNNSQTACQKADEAKGIEDMEPSMELSSLQLEDLPEEAAEKVFELLNDLGVDDRLALFIQQYTFELRTKQHVEKINALKAFIDQIGN